MTVLFLKRNTVVCPSDGVDTSRKLRGYTEPNEGFIYMCIKRIFDTVPFSQLASSFREVWRIRWHNGPFYIENSTEEELE